MDTQKAHEIIDETFGATYQDNLVAGWTIAEAQDYINETGYTDYTAAEVIEAIDTVRTSHAAAALGRKGGSKTSEAKKASSAANGRKGGRPPKVKADKLVNDGSINYLGQVDLPDETETQEDEIARLSALGYSSIE